MASVAEPAERAVFRNHFEFQVYWALTSLDKAIWQFSRKS